MTPIAFAAMSALLVVKAADTAATDPAAWVPLVVAVLVPPLPCVLLVPDDAEPLLRTQEEWRNSLGRRLPSACPPLHGALRGWPGDRTVCITHTAAVGKPCQARGPGTGRGGAHRPTLSVMSGRPASAHGWYRAHRKRSPHMLLDVSPR